MTIQHILAMKSESGEILLSDKSDDFMASFKGGKWIADDVFECADLEENFWHIRDNTEVLRLIAEAKTVLSQTETKAKAG